MKNIIIDFLSLAIVMLMCGVISVYLYLLVQGFKSFPKKDYTLTQNQKNEDENNNPDPPSNNDNVDTSS